MLCLQELFLTLQETVSCCWVVSSLYYVQCVYVYLKIGRILVPVVKTLLCSVGLNKLLTSPIRELLISKFFCFTGEFTMLYNAEMVGKCTECGVLELKPA